jgi:eukaryotic-like serine/threonine-protein kinase
MGSRLGRYSVLKHLASGGMADVLLGRTDGIEGFERHVVLKRIRPEHARDQRFIRMFLDEARVAANLHHQHIVQVHDIGEAGGEFFIAMEYIHGEDVRTLLSNASKTRAHVPLGVAIAIVSAAAAGLHYAHERRGADKRPLGIVHRDVSPSNILVGYDGSVKVVDFGIAKASMRQETRSGSLKGKISYMSPEQCKGSDVDRRSDVYSLGVVLYELATTTRLFKGENDYLVMDQIVNGRVSLPRVRRPDLPNELSAIIMRAIAPDPERRYFTADELRVALDQFASKGGLTSSTSAIGAFLRKQFGERPEPWLDLDGQGDFSFSDAEVPLGDAPPSNSWTELPRNGDEAFRRSSNSMISRNTGPIGVTPSVTPSDSGALDSARQGTVRSSSHTPPPTESKMGWESQPRNPAPRGFTPAKVAMICAPLVLLLIIAAWRLAVTGSASPATATATHPAMQPAPSSAPMVTPIPEPPQVIVEGSVGAAINPTRGTKADPAATPGKSRPSPTPSSSSASSSSSSSTGSKRPTGSKIDASPTPTPARPEVAASTPPVASPTPVVPPAAGPLLGPATAPPAPAPAPVVAALPLPAQSPPPPTPPQNVTPTALDANRLSGDKEISPDNTTQSEIGRSGVDKVMGSFKLCITPEGNVSSVTQLKSTGFAQYDAKIQNTIRNKWRYRPYIVNGKPASVCTAVRFIYSQR